MLWHQRFWWGLFQVNNVITHLHKSVFFCYWYSINFITILIFSSNSYRSGLLWDRNIMPYPFHFTFCLKVQKVKLRRTKTSRQRKEAQYTKLTTSNHVHLHNPPPPPHPPSGKESWVGPRLPNIFLFSAKNCSIKPTTWNLLLLGCVYA